VKRYRTIVADPPWTPDLGSTWATRFTDKARPQAQYQTMTGERIAALKPPADDQAFQTNTKSAHAFDFYCRQRKTLGDFCWCRFFQINKLFEPIFRNVHTKTVSKISYHHFEDDVRLQYRI
jgi:hypothetical protein